MQTRLMKPTAKVKVSAPRNQAEWHRLMLATLERATEANSRLVTGMREAHAKGQAEKLLRKLGIIHLNDLERLFPR